MSPKGLRYRIKTYASGRRVKQEMLGDRVLRTTPLPRVHPNKTRRKLARRRRRIGL